MSELVNELDFIDANLQTMNVDQIVAAQNALEEERKANAQNNANEAAATTAATTKPAEETVDFSKPLAPATPLSGAPQNAAAPAAPPAPAFKIPANVPMVGAAPPGGGSNHLYLGLILSLLLIAAGVAIAVKRGMLRNIMLKRGAAAAMAVEPAAAAAPPNAEEVPVTEAGEKKSFEEVAEEFNAEENEEIELAAAPPAPEPATTAPEAPPAIPEATVETTTAPDDLQKFEKEFEKMDLNQLAPEAPPKAEAPPKTEPLQPEPPPKAEPPPQAEAPLLNPEAAAPTPAPVFKTSLKLASDEPDNAPPTMEKVAAAPAPKLEKTEGPTMVPAPDSIIDNSEAVQIKLDLAKKYLETGDRESAKALLQEIIEIANDTQKIEAQLLLSGIL